jgi:transposase-like protein
MSRIVPNIDSLKLHQKILISDPERYRPDHCPSCQSSSIWNHGHYLRYPDRGLESGGRFNPVTIQRYFCSECGKTCSRLPQCIPPRRWYVWLVQQFVLKSILSGESFNSVSKRVMPSRSTLLRWMQWLNDRSGTFRFHLATLYPEWERQAGFEGYWLEAWDASNLSCLMMTLDRHGVTVP